MCSRTVRALVRLPALLPEPAAILAGLRFAGRCAAPAGRPARRAGYLIFPAGRAERPMWNARQASGCPRAKYGFKGTRRRPNLTKAGDAHSARRSRLLSSRAIKGSTSPTGGEDALSAARECLVSPRVPTLRFDIGYPQRVTALRVHERAYRRHGLVARSGLRSRRHRPWRDY